jgi:aminopeptidase-like protein
LKAITEALREIDDHDYEWRVFVEKLLIDAYIDNNKMERAKDFTMRLIKFIDTSIPKMFNEFFEFAVRRR